MKNRPVLVMGVTLILVLLLLAACGPSSASAPKTTATPVKAAWEADWEKALAAARQEGKLVIASGGGIEGRDAMSQGLKKLGIDAEITIGTIPQLLPKIKAERQAGLYLWDINISGPPPMLLTLKPEGLIEYPIDSQLILPEATNPDTIKKVWFQEKFPWVDKDHSVYIVSLRPSPIMVVNTNMVKEGDIKSYRDVLDPKWKGKIIMLDPTVPSAAQLWVGGVCRVMGEDFIKELVKAEPTITRDQRLHLDWVAQGKMAIGLAPDSGTLADYEKVGAPIKIVTPSEGTFLAPGASGISLWKNAPHPSAAKVFMNWIASKEGQEVYAAAEKQQSLRLDVSATGLAPWQTRQPGVKYADAYTEEFSFYRRDVSDKVATTEFGKLVKK